MIDYLFFKFYRLWKYSSYSEIAVYAALLILAVFLNCNIHTIWGVLEQYKILPYPTRTMYNVSLGLIFILLCIRFCWKRRYKAVIEKFNEKPNKNNLLILILYIASRNLSIIFIDIFRKNIIKSNFEVYNEVHSGFTVSSTHAGMNPHFTAFLTERIFDHAEQ